MTRTLRPTLADLWRTSLDRLERQGVVDPPAEARTQAIAALTHRSARLAEARFLGEPDDEPGVVCRELTCSAS